MAAAEPANNSRMTLRRNRTGSRVEAGRRARRWEERDARKDLPIIAMRRLWFARTPARRGRYTGEEEFRQEFRLELHSTILEVYSIPGCRYNCNLAAWGYSSAGRALAWHARGQRFDPAYLHQDNAARPNRRGGSRSRSPSSRGLGHHPVTVSTGVRIPLGTPVIPGSGYSFPQIG